MIVLEVLVSLFASFDNGAMMVLKTKLYNWGQLFGRQVSTNPGLKVKRGFDFSSIKMYIRTNI